MVVPGKHYQLKQIFVVSLSAVLFALGSQPARATSDADLACAYSPGSAAALGGEANLQIGLANAIAASNVAHDNSGTGVHYHIAGFLMSTSNPVSVDNAAVLGMVASDAGYADVRNFSTGIGADLLNYVSQSTGAAGNAYQPGTMSAIGSGSIWWTYYVHELGHNYGGNHADGYRSPTGGWCTVMRNNYCGGGCLPYFSNPNLYYNGVQLLGVLDSCFTSGLVNNGNNAGIIASYALTRANAAHRVTVAPALTNVVYHWSFTNAAGSAPASTVVLDSVSGAQAIVRGTNAVFTGSALRLPGGTTGNVAASAMAAYIDLPNGIISAQTNLTIEIWATPLSSQNWQRLCSFGRTAEAGNGAAGEWTGAPGSAAPGTTTAYDELTLTLDIAVSSLGSQRLICQGYGLSTNALDSSLPTLAGAQQFYTLTFQDGVGANGAAGGRVTWYRNGDPVTYQDVNFHLRNLADVNNWLGRSMWSADAQANVDYAEVRLSNIAMTKEQVKANFALGPNFVPVAAAPAIAGNLYVDLRAGYAAGTTWTNLGSLENFFAVNSPVITANVASTGIPGVYFDGTSAAYLGPVTVADLEGKSDRTIEVWAYDSVLTSEQSLVSWSHRNSGDVNLALCIGTNTSWGAAQHWADDLGWGNSVPAAGAWHHLVYVYDGNLVKVYADGVVQNSRALSGTMATASGEPINLACQRETANGTRSIFFNGYINSVRVHGGALTPQQVWNNYLVGPSVAPTNAPTAPTGLTATAGSLQVSLAWNPVANVASYNVKRGLITGGTYTNITSVKTPAFTDTNLFAGTNYFYVVTAVNLIGESTNSTEVSAAPLALPGTPNVTGNLYVNLWASGANSVTWTNYGSFSNFTNATGTPVFTANVGGTGIPGVYFNGSSAFQGQTTVTNLEGNSARTIEVWAYAPSLSSEPTMVSWGYRGGSDCNLAFNFGNDATWGAATHINDDVGWGPTPPTAGAWHHLVYIYDGNGMVKLFVDGQLRNRQVLFSQLGTIAGMPVNLGCQRDFLATRSHFFTGYLNSVRVYGGALAAAQVAANYQLGPVTAASVPTSVTRIWRGDGASNLWNTATSTNWFNGTTRDYFYSGNNVTFDDSATNGTVNLTNAVIPNAVLVNATSNYTFTGAGKISGPASLTKTNSGTLTIANTNDYQGATVINGGTVKLKPQVSSDCVLHLSFDSVNGTAVGSIATNTGSGGNAMNGVVTSAAVSYVAGKFGNALSLSGTGAYLKITNKVVTTDASGSWTVALWLKTTTTGAAYLYQGDGGWGSGNTQFYLNNGNTTSGGRKVGAVRYAGNWTVGTTTIVISDNGGTQSIYVDGIADTVAASMANASVGSQVWIGGRGDTSDGTAAFNGLIDEVYMFSRALSQTEVQTLMTANNPGTAPALPNTTALTVAAGATLNLAGASQTVTALAGATNGSIILGDASAYGIFNVSNAADNNFAGNLSGSGVFVKQGAGALTLGGSNSYSGPTTVGAGSLIVNGQIGGGAVTVATNAMLGGNGKIFGPVTVQSGATFAPGNSIGTLAISNSLTLSSNSTTILEISKAGGATTNDAVVGLTSVVLGGTLNVTNLGGTALAAGDAFKLFSATAYSGSFAVTNLPALGNYLYWTNNLAVNGTLAVASSVSLVSTNILWNVGGTSVTLSWPADHLGWRLLMQTNHLANGLSLNLNDWTTVPASQTTNQMTLPLDSSLPGGFYRLVFP